MATLFHSLHTNAGLHNTRVNSLRVKLCHQAEPRPHVMHSVAVLTSKIYEREVKRNRCQVSMLKRTRHQQWGTFFMVCVFVCVCTFLCSSTGSKNKTIHSHVFMRAPECLHAVPMSCERMKRERCLSNETRNCQCCTLFHPVAFQRLLLRETEAAREAISFTRAL